MLRTRILTAIVLILLVGASLWVDTPWPFLLLLSLATACALWEWLRLTAPRNQTHLGAAIAMAVLTLAIAWIWLAPHSAVYTKLLVYGVALRGIVPIALLGWLLTVPSVIRGRVDAPPHSAGWSMFAVFALLAAWIALSTLLLAHGALFVLTLMALVWVADIGAYFVGRALGRHKLAPRVSPGKTWEGALGGLVLGLAYMALSAQWPASFAQVLVQQWGWAGALAWTVLLIAASVIGDLFESLLKRRAGQKDSSRLLPGHGGVFDRIDALLPVAPIAVLLTGVVF